jgi:hypothetical protein
MPERIQLRRTKGWRKPEGAIVVARPSMWGNPFTIAGAREAGWDGTIDELRHECVASFRQFLADRYMWSAGEAIRSRILSNIHKLRGHDLACWCPLDAPCHADVLLELANRGAENGATE